MWLQISPFTLELGRANGLPLTYYIFDQMTASQLNPDIGSGITLAGVRTKR